MPTDRTRIRDALIAFARNDPSIVGAALVGSAARDAEDDWSDIDLALQLGNGVDEPNVVDRWTRRMEEECSVADTFDVMAGGVRYRVFLLSSSLQIDVSFWPNDQFRATDTGFRLIFGQANPSTDQSAPRFDDAIGMGWLYALHARSAIARGKSWQAVMMLDELRNAILTLVSLHRGLNPGHGREVDKLPADALRRIAHARASSLASNELSRSLNAHVNEFLDAVAVHDDERQQRLTVPLRIIATLTR